MIDCFLAGMMAHDGLRIAVFGAAGAQPAHLHGYRVAGVIGGLAGHVTSGGDGVDGVILRLAGDDLARLDHVMRSTGAQPSDAVVTVDGMARPARLWRATDPDAPDWDGAEWAETLAPTLIAALPDILALQGTDPAQIARRLPAMLVRSSSRLRAAHAAPQTLRRAVAPDDVAVTARRQPYANFFSVEEYDLSFRRFDGSMSPVINRAAFVSGDAVTLLPYDPARDRVLLIEQFRAGPFVRGDTNPWSLEAIAGRIDAGETPEQAGRREAVEEAGLTVGKMIPVAGYYPSPAAKMEFLYSFVALADLPDGVAGVFGVEGEAEDIRGHLIGFDRLMALVDSGEINNAPLVLTALWLQRERPRLRAGVSPR